MKFTTFSTLSIASLALLFSACGNAANTNANNTTANTANKSNTAAVVNSNQTAVNNTSSVSNTSSNTRPTPAGESGADKVQGKLQAGKTESVILYVGEESGDYAGYCFTNDSEAGRAILAACKDGDQCEVNGTVSEGSCKVPGLEADLSASGKITKVTSAKSLGSKK
jgi:protein involved in sex pheromone biosynthesis